MLQFIKTTVFGGVVFLVPVVILVILIGKAMAFSQKIAAPIAEYLPFGPVANLVLVDVLGLGLIILICFFGGLAAKSQRVANWVASIEETFLSKIPVYSVIKGTVTNTLQLDEMEGMKPVIAHFDDCSQVGYEVERKPGGKVTVFLPGAPDAFSGSVNYFSEDRITPIDANLLSTVKVMKGFGKGSRDNLQAL